MKEHHNQPQQRGEKVAKYCQVDRSIKRPADKVPVIHYCEVHDYCAVFGRTSELASAAIDQSRWLFNEDSLVDGSRTSTEQELKDLCLLPLVFFVGQFSQLEACESLADVHPQRILITGASSTFDVKAS